MILKHYPSSPLITVNARKSFDLWREIFSKNMTANVHLLIAHGDLYLRWVWVKLSV